MADIRTIAGAAVICIIVTTADLDKNASQLKRLCLRIGRQ